MIVPSLAGGPTDIVGRVVAERRSAKWDVLFVVENMPGAGSNIGMDRFAKSSAEALSCW